MQKSIQAPSIVLLSLILAIKLSCICNVYFIVCVGVGGLY